MFPGVLLESRINVETRPRAIVIPRSAMVENVQTIIDPESNTIRLERSYAAFVTQGDTLAVNDATLSWVFSRAIVLKS